ncbi:DUF262 domain-containing protein [Paeniglutamicibacter sp.]|uniref:DUF262 domain-containing protein n=1 Tax=Paeniglutamicibacter sp. TaxID=1934391 RepID=UPI003989B5F9
MNDESFNRQGFESEEPADITRERWIRAQRDLITTTLDYNLQTVASLVGDGRIDLSPSFQRRDRWDLKRRSLLIESFLMNVPLPPVFLNEDEYGHYSIIDGKQRLTTISEFLNDGFQLQGLSIFSEANGLYFSQLDDSLKSVLQTRSSIRSIILLRMSDPLIKFHVFQRLNTGGVRLNSQEVRNVTFAGPFNDAIVSAATYPTFTRLLGIGSDEAKRSKSALWQQMRDVELVLRYLTLRENWSSFSGSLGGAMNTYLMDSSHMRGSEIERRLAYFHETVEKVDVAFGDMAFKRVRQSQKSSRILATLYDAQMIAAEEFSYQDLEASKNAIQNGMFGLLEDNIFTKSIGAQTNTPKYVKTRISMVRDMITVAISG